MIIEINRTSQVLQIYEYCYLFLMSIPLQCANNIISLSIGNNETIITNGNIHCAVLCWTRDFMCDNCKMFREGAPDVILVINSITVTIITVTTHSAHHNIFHHMTCFKRLDLSDNCCLFRVGWKDCYVTKMNPITRCCGNCGYSCHCSGAVLVMDVVVVVVSQVLLS